MMSHSRLSPLVPLVKKGMKSIDDDRTGVSAKPPRSPSSSTRTLRAELTARRSAGETASVSLTPPGEAAAAAAAAGGGGLGAVADAAGGRVALGPWVMVTVRTKS